jgi:hypothetical protein
MRLTSYRTSDGGSIVAGVAILALVAALVLAACGIHAIALARYAEAEKRAFLSSVEANNEMR